MVMWRWRGLSVSAAMRSPRRRGHSAAFWVAAEGASQRAAATGSTVIAMMSDTPIATEIVSARSANSCPSVFFMKITGRNTMIVVSVEAKSAGQTWIAPSSAACAGEAPRSRRSRMLSSTMVAASSVMPTANAMPAIEITFSVWPVTSMTSTVASTLTGIAMPTRSVERNWRRNSHSTPTARMTPCKQVAGHEADRLVDEDRRIERLLDRKAKVRERPFAKLPDLFLDRVQRREHVGAGFLQDLDRDRRVVVLHRERVAVAPFDRDRGDVGKVHRPAIAPVEHELAEVFGAVAAREAQRVLAPAELGEAARDVVGAAGDARDRRYRDAEFRGAVRIELDAKLIGCARIDVDGADARDRLDARAHQVLDLAAIISRRDPAFRASAARRTRTASGSDRCRHPGRGKCAARRHRAAEAEAGSCAR
jgi:hypothetical protein